MENKKKVDFNFGVRGWVLILYCFLSFFLVTGSKDILLNMAAGMLAEQHGWNYPLMISLNTVFGWMTVVFVILAGQAMRKISAKWMAVAFGAIFGLTLLVLPHISAFWMYVVILAAITVINILWLQQCNNTITANWFPQKRGMVMGITTIGLPLGSGLGPKVYAVLMFEKGLSFQTIYTIFAVIIFAVVFLAVFLIKDYPEQCGAFPDNNKDMSTEKAKAALAEGQKMAEESVWNTKNMLATKETWFVALSCGILQLYSNGFMGQMVPRLTAAGYEKDAATNMMMIAAFAACIGSFFIGWLDQQIGPKKATVVTHCTAVIACFLNIVPNTACVVISIAFIGLTLGGSANFLTSLTSALWGRYSFGKAFRVVLPICQLIGCSGLLLVAQLSAKFGYNGAYTIVACLGVFAIILTCMIKMDGIEKKERNLK